MKTRLLVTLSVNGGTIGSKVTKEVDVEVPTEAQMGIAGMTKGDYLEKMSKEILFDMFEFSWEEVQC